LRRPRVVAGLEEGGREGGREGEEKREGGREGGRERGREGERKEKREGEREDKGILFYLALACRSSTGPPAHKRRRLPSRRHTEVVHCQQLEISE
jgi:hypothetical protein